MRSRACTSGGRSPRPTPTPSLGSSPACDSNGRQPPEEMLSTIFDRLGPAIMRDLLARYRGLLREADAHDLLAITAARAWSAWERFDPAKGSLAAWVRTIAVHATANALASGFLRHRCRERSISLSSFRDLKDGASAPGDDEAPDDDGGPTARPRSALLEIVATLSPAQRAILMADAASPQGTADTHALARELGLSPASIRVYRMRAKQTVRAEWECRGLPIPLARPGLHR
jgi:DNA-directed RNA polymerase specialized sigma24 family protein